MIELYPHNQVAYDKLCLDLEGSNKACITHCTGSGKSYIMFKYIEDHISDDTYILIITESNNAETQHTDFIQDVSNSLKEEGQIAKAELLSDNLEIITYRKLRDTGYRYRREIIILDEFHLCGARETSKKINTLLYDNKSSIIIGFSATPVRHDGTNMVDELFDGKISSRMDLYDAIEVENIFPQPDYISCVYDKPNDHVNVLDDLSFVKLSDMETADILRVRASITHSLGIAAVFEETMRYKDGKYMVFCKTTKQLNDLIDKAKTEWFTWLDSPLHIFYEHYHSKSSNKGYEAFIKCRKKGLKLFFSINMCTHALHSKEIDGVINFRPAHSEALYVQIIGRSFSIKGQGQSDKINPPQIYDIVDSLELLTRRNPWAHGNGVIMSEDEFVYPVFSKDDSGTPEGQNKSKPVGLYRVEKANHENQYYILKLKHIMKRRMPWREAFTIAERYFYEHGDLRVPPYTVIDGFDIYGWVNSQRYAFHHRDKRKISDLQIRMLRDIGMDWEYDPLWELRYEECKLIYEQMGWLAVSKSLCPKGSPLPGWVARQRQRYFGKAGKPLTPDQILRLEAIGMIWDPRNTRDIWSIHLSEALRYKQMNHHINIHSTGETADLYRWTKQNIDKYAFDSEHMPLPRIRQIESLGAMKGVHYLFLSKYQKYIYMYSQIYDSSFEPASMSSELVAEIKKAGRWIIRQNEKSSRGELTPEEETLLEDLKEVRRAG